MTAAGCEPERLAEVYTAHWSWTVRFITARVRTADWHWAEDLAQQTFLRAWPYLGSLRDERRLRGWLATIAAHVVADHYRSGPARWETPTASESPRWAAPAGGDPAGHVAALEQLTAVAGALEQLPAETRRVLLLRVVEQLPIAVVAKRVHRGKERTRQLLGEGLAALRAQLGEPDPAPAAGESWRHGAVA